MLRRLTRLSAGGLVGLLIALWVGEAGADITKQFLVTDCRTNRPVAGAKIRALLAAAGSGSATQANTDPKGFAVLSPLRFEGIHRFEVSAPGYQPKTTPGEFLKAGSLVVNRVCLDLLPPQKAPVPQQEVQRSPSATVSQIGAPATEEETAPSATTPAPETTDEEERIREETAPRLPSASELRDRARDRASGGKRKRRKRPPPVVVSPGQPSDEATDEQIQSLGQKLREMRTRERQAGGTRAGQPSQVTERDDDIFYGPPPPDWPTTFHDGEREKDHACKIMGASYGLAQLYFPDTKEYLEPPQDPPGQEALNHPAIGAHNMLLHDRSYFENPVDLMVPSVGVNFKAGRTYRSNIKTKEGGLFGYNWDFFYYKRLVPQGGELIPDEGLRRESINAPGKVHFMPGNGRVEVMRPSRVQFQTVKNFDSRFRAIVTYYRPPRNKFVELERYALYPGERVKYMNHDNWEGEMFYVMRYKSGYREIYSCRGILLYVEDRHGNTMELKYTPPFHPFTFNPKLKQIIDTAQRVYELKWVPIQGTGQVNTNYKGQPIKGTYPKLRLERINELGKPQKGGGPPAGRSVEYHYRGGNQTPVLEEVEEKKGGSFKTRYAYSELDERYYLETLTMPREVAQGGGPYITNQWKQEGDVKRLVGQTLGRPAAPDPAHGFEGGAIFISAEGGPGSPVTILRPSARGKITYTLGRPGVAYVVTRKEVELDDGSLATTQIAYNDSDQVVRIERPEGNVILYKYEPANAPVREGEVRDWEEGRVTYLNNLARGNLREKTLLAGKRENPLDYDHITIKVEYDPLYNQTKRMEGPGLAVTERRFDYIIKGAEGNPLSEWHPRRTTAEGDPIGPIETDYWYNRRGQVVSVKDPFKHATVYTYDGLGYLSRVESIDGRAAMVRDSRGNLTRLEDVRGAVTTYKVNLRDLVELKTEDAEGFKNETTYRYDENGNLTRETVTVQGNVSNREAFAMVAIPTTELVKTYTYNAVNLLTQETHRAGNLTRTRAYGYDQEGKLVFLREPEGRETEYDLDNLGNVTEKRIAGLLTESFTYDKNGDLLTRKRGQKGGTYRFQTDPFDRPYKTTTPDGTEMVSYPNPDGTTRHLHIEGKNHEGKKVALKHVEYLYDELQAPIVITEHILDPSGAKQGERKERFVRDGEGKVRKIIRGSNNVTTITYQGHQKDVETDVYGNQVSYAFEPGGLPTYVCEDEKEVKYTVAKDADRYQRKPPVRSEGENSYCVHMGYDRLGRMIWAISADNTLTEFAYDSEGGIWGKHDSSGRVDVFKLDGLGRQKEERLFSNLGPMAIQATHEYDLLDHQVATTVKRNGQKVSEITRKYHPTGLLVQLVRDGKTSTYGYDSRGNLRTESRKYSGVELEHFYDTEDRHTRTAVTYPDHSVGRSTSETFAYDGLGRLTEASRYGGKIKNRMEYDSLGNVLTEIQYVNGHPMALFSRYDSNGLRVTLNGPSFPGERLRLKTDRDMLGRVTALRYRMGADGYWREAVVYEYSGVSRFARRTIGGTEHSYFGYDFARRTNRSTLYSDRIHRMVSAFEEKFDQGRPATQSFRITLPDESTHREVQSFEYTPWGARKATGEAYSWSDTPTGSHSRGSSRRVFTYNGDRVDKVYAYVQSDSWLPGTLIKYGGNLVQTVSGEVENFVWNGKDHVRTDFRTTAKEMGFTDFAAEMFSKLFFSEVEHKDLNGGLSDAQFQSQIDRKAEHKHSTWFRYDRDGNLTEDNRFLYEYDHRGLLSRVEEKWTFSRGYGIAETRYYDYANRLVYTEYGPKTVRADFSAVFPNRRILYDGYLPFIEAATSGTGRPVRVDVAYATHPEGLDVGPIWVRSFYDVRGGIGKKLEPLYPFFDATGRLTHVYDPAAQKYFKTGFLLDSVTRHWARRRHVALARVDKETRPEDLVALKPEQRRREIPLTSIRTRWDAFSEGSLDLHSGRLALDPTRNLELRLKSVQEAVSNYTAEGIARAHMDGLQLMSLLAAPVFLPIAAVEWGVWEVAKYFIVDVAFDYFFRRVVLGHEYGLSELKESLVFATLFAMPMVIGAERQAMEGARLLRGARRRLRPGPPGASRTEEAPASVANAADGPASRSTLPLPKDEPSEVPLEWMWTDVEGGLGTLDARRAWDANVGLRDRLVGQVLGVIRYAADGGYRPARQLLEDVANGVVKIFWAPELKSAGLYWGGQRDVLWVNPFFRGTTQPRSIHEIAGTLIHEYSHRWGYNEVRAFWEELRFYLRITTRSGRSLESILPTEWKLFNDLQRIGENNGYRAAVGFLRRQLATGPYSLEHYNGNVLRFIVETSSRAGGASISLQIFYEFNPHLLEEAYAAVLRGHFWEPPPLPFPF